MCPGSPYFSTSPRVYEDPPSPARLLSVWSGSIPPSESDARYRMEARAEMTDLASDAVRFPDRLLTIGAFDRMGQIQIQRFYEGTCGAAPRRLRRR